MAVEKNIRRENDLWILESEADGSAVHSRWLVDASGRRASAARLLGLRPRKLDDLLAVSLRRARRAGGIRRCCRPSNGSSLSIVMRQALKVLSGRGPGSSIFCMTRQTTSREWWANTNTTSLPPMTVHL
jgi:hypothetical protein